MQAIYLHYAISIDIILVLIYIHNMQYRTFGRTGLKTSIVGFGGIVVMNISQDDADRVVASAIERGVNYFDVAPSYGNAQIRLGHALTNYRDGVILACKTGQCLKEDALRELHQSLEALRTDHFDIYQFHGVPNIDALDKIFSSNGAIHAFTEARDKGLIKFIGITCHDPKVALEAFNRFDFDSILFPINFVYWLKYGIGKEVLEAAANRNMGRAAMKGMALKKWEEGVERRWDKCWYQPNDDPHLAELAFRFTLSQDVHVFIPPGHLELFEMAMEFSERYKPISEDELKYLQEQAITLESIFS